ncbi:MAG: ABC transporter substrate-binding protein [Myxococcales bacterium]|nr:ABC transporter substrate-binding protein [Myxococcales bacterium]MCB9582204.1 ABC transporter substrate-binding protein [Polyangiaceae bacterium]
MTRLTRREWLAISATLAIACERSQRSSDTRTPRRVVSLSPGTTESVFAIGAGSRLVGRSKFCDFPAEAAKLPSVGGFVDPSFEAILGLAPDLVIGVQGPGGRELADRLSQRGIATYFPGTDSFAEITAMLHGLGERLDSSAGAKRVTDDITAQRKAVAKALEGRPRPRALMVFGLRPIVVAGRGGFPNEMLTLAGADNVVTSERYPTLGVERVLALDPDVVIDTTGVAGHKTEQLHADLPGWKELRAIKEHHLVVIDDERVMRPGPRVGQGLVVLAKALHPKVSIPS